MQGSSDGVGRCGPDGDFCRFAFVIFNILDDDLQVDQRVAHDTATFEFVSQGVDQQVLHFDRHRVRLQLVLDIQSRVVLNGLHNDGDRCKLAAALCLSIESTFRFDLSRDSFAIRDSRLVSPEFHVEVTFHPLADDFQVQFTHAADDRLTGFFTDLGGEGRILLHHQSQRVFELFAISAAVGFDRHRDHRFGKLDRFQNDWVLLIAKRVTGHRFLGADDPDDVSTDGFVECFSRIRLDSPDLADQFLGARSGIQHARTTLQCP